MLKPNIILDESAIAVEKTAVFQIERGAVPITLFQNGLAGSELIDIQLFGSPENLKDDLVVEDCEDAWNESVDADVTSGVDAVNKKVGTNSVDLIVAAGASANDILATEVIAKDLSGYDQIKLWVLSTVNASAGDFQLLLDDTADCASPVLALDLPALSAGVWKHCVLPFDRNTAGLKNLISIGLKYVTDIGAVTINVDDIRAEQRWDNLRIGAADVTLDTGDSHVRIDQPGLFRAKCTASVGRVRVGTY